METVATLPPSSEPAQSESARPELTPADPIAAAIKDRVLSVGGKDNHFPFLVIDKPELWAEASYVHGTYQMPIIGTGRFIKFCMHGPSMEQWESLEAKFIIPEWEDEGEPPPEHNDRRKAVINERRVAILEMCLNKKIPGDDAAAKINFLNQRSPGESDALFQYIENTLCNWSDSPDTTLLNEYTKASQRAVESVIEFKTFDDWKEANETQYIFRMQRPTDDYLIEIPLKGLSKDQKSEIAAATKETPPPEVPLFSSHNKSFDKTRSRPNHQDPAWLKRTRTLAQQRTVMYFDACLPFLVPGNNVQEKYSWISKRLVGDITKLKEFIERELLTYGSRYNFFTRR